jgi:hypothetical protein
MQKLRQDKPGAKRPKPRQWFRPRSVKKMLIEMERPFVWPEVPDLEKYVVLFLFVFWERVGRVVGREGDGVKGWRLMFVM